jgi:glucose/arabinose dehydrogenase
MGLIGGKLVLKIKKKPRLDVLTLLAFLASASFDISAEQDAGLVRHVFASLNGDFVAERVLDDISQPAAIEFLPDGRALVLQRDRGLITIANFSTEEKTNVEGLPNLVVFSDAGVHDVELHPDYDSNGWIYITYSEGEQFHSTVALDRFRLDGFQAIDVERIFTADAFSEGAYHFAARIQFSEGFLYMAMGDREHPPMAQDNSNHAGTVVRLADDGSVPKDNPFVGLEEEGKPIPRPANYGWPVVSYGLEYDGGPVGMGIPWKEGMEFPHWVYDPSIAPSDMVIYQGDAFPAWKGNFLIGAMAGLHLNRLVLRQGEVVAEERLAQRLLGRIRSVAVDKDGLIYVGSDSGQIWRLQPL